MPLPGILPRDASEVEKLRNAFISRPVRPTYAELSSEFDVPLSTIGTWSSQEGWIAMRSAHWERKSLEGDALALVHEAATRVNRPVIVALTNAILLIVQEVTACAQSVDPAVQKSPTTRAQILNTCSFAINNIASACKSIGIVGLQKELKELGATREGGWTPALQQQINLTIQNAVAAPASAKEPAAAQPVEVKSESVSTS
jgi:hypothetical protein